MSSAASPRSARPSSAAQPEQYWVQSRQPLASLVFIAPLLIVYEAGVLFFLFVYRSDAARNGADAWLRWLLEWLGFGQYFLLPALTVCLLLAWHHTTRQPWRISRGLLYGMTGESILLAVCLRLILMVQGSLFHLAAEPEAMSIGARAAMLIGFLGAGIYEELLFRLMMLPAGTWLFRRLKVAPRMALLGSVLLTSVLFAAAHHVGPYGEPFDAFSFLFRLVAGVFFSVLFIYRGFGIAAGTHAGYDILIGLFA